MKTAESWVKGVGGTNDAVYTKPWLIDESVTTNQRLIARFDSGVRGGAALLPQVLSWEGREGERSEQQRKDERTHAHCDAAAAALESRDCDAAAGTVATAPSTTAAGRSGQFLAGWESFVAPACRVSQSAKLEKVLRRGQAERRDARCPLRLMQLQI